MTKKDLLKKRYEMACHNLLCYSKNYAMSEAKEGYEAQWKLANEECELLQEMIDEYVDDRSCKTKFIGKISSYLVDISKVHDEQFIKHLVISDRDGNHRMFEIDYEVGKEILSVHDNERHERYDQGKDTNIIFTVRNSLASIESWEWKVK